MYVTAASIRLSDALVFYSRIFCVENVYVSERERVRGGGERPMHD